MTHPTPTAPDREPLLSTPGPWHCMMVNRRWAIYPESARNDGVDYFIAYTASVQDKAREKANAAMLAAAPELLAACKAALGAFENNNAIDWSDLIRAIAKAEGRT